MTTRRACAVDGDPRAGFHERGRAEGFVGNVKREPWTAGECLRPTAIFVVGFAEVGWGWEVLFIVF